MAKLLLTSCLALLVAQHDAATAPNVLMVKKKETNIVCDHEGCRESDRSPLQEISSYRQTDVWTHASIDDPHVN